MTQRIPINLASAPFRRDRPLLVASATVGVLLFLLLAVMTYLVVLERNRASEARVAIAQLERQISTQQREQTRIDGILRQEANAEVLERSVFLNALLLRKGISWTKLFGDMETVMPPTVRLVSVRPQVTAQNQLQLDVVVASNSTEPVIDMLMKFEQSPVFGATAIASWLPPSQTEPFYRYRLTVSYAQKL